MEDEATASGAAAPKKGRKATTGKSAAKKPAAARVAANPAAPDLAVKVRRKQVVERVTAAVGANKGSVRDVVNATLAVLGEALKAGEALDLPAFGKARVAKPGKDNGTKAGAMTIKLRPGTASSEAKPKGKKPAKEALAEADEEG